MATGDFGRRGAGDPSSNASPPLVASPLLKQISGVALGVLIVVAVGASARYGMKQLGSSLDGHFVESARPADPQGAFAKVDQPDKLLQTTHNFCVAATARLNLTDTQRSALGRDPTTWLGVHEELLMRSGAYVACLATESQHRFCHSMHRQHLAAATAEYFKQLRMLQEEWILRNSPPGYANGVFARSGPLRASDMRSPQGVPSSQIDADMLKGLRTLAEKGLLTSEDIAGLSFTARQGLAPVFKGLKTAQGKCS